MMTIKTLLAAAALTVPVLGTSLPALAASAHNLQSGTHSSNTYDTAESAAQKQQKLEGQSLWGASR